jgi:hypothetical protein
MRPTARAGVRSREASAHVLTIPPNSIFVRLRGLTNSEWQLGIATTVSSDVTGLGRPGIHGREPEAIPIPGSLDKILILSDSECSGAVPSRAAQSRGDVALLRRALSFRVDDSTPYSHFLQFGSNGSLLFT